MSRNYGMNWHDASPDRDAAGKVERAIQFYLSVYFVPPTLVLISADMLTEGPLSLEGINVRASKSLPANAMWLGASHD